MLGAPFNLAFQFGASRICSCLLLLFYCFLGDSHKNLPLDSTTCGFPIHLRLNQPSCWCTLLRLLLLSYYCFFLRSHFGGSVGFFFDQSRSVILERIEYGIFQTSSHPHMQESHGNMMENHGKTYSSYFRILQDVYSINQPTKHVGYKSPFASLLALLFAPKHLRVEMSKA